MCLKSLEAEHQAMYDEWVRMVKENSDCRHHCKCASRYRRRIKVLEERILRLALQKEK